MSEDAVWSCPNGFEIGRGWALSMDCLLCPAACFDACKKQFAATCPGGHRLYKDFDRFDNCDVCPESVYNMCGGGPQ
jgi:hypothetical protein